MKISHKFLMIFTDIFYIVTVTLLNKSKQLMNFINAQGRDRWRRFAARRVASSSGKRRGDRATDGAECPERESCLAATATAARQPLQPAARQPANPPTRQPGRQASVG